MSTTTKNVFRCPKCRAARVESVRGHDADGRLMTRMRCSRCAWCQDPAIAQFEFEFDDRPSSEPAGVRGRGLGPADLEKIDPIYEDK